MATLTKLILLGLWGTGGLGGEHGGGVGTLFPSLASPLRELARGAFLSSWPVTSTPALSHLSQESLHISNEVDKDDCGKKFLCELARKDAGQMYWDELLMLKYYDRTIDYASKSLFFNIAVKVGKDRKRPCAEVYPRCSLELQEMLDILRRQGISFDIPGEERDCQVYFIWKKKNHKKESKKETVIQESNPEENET